MAVLEASRTARPSWANARTVLGLLLFCGALLAGQRLLQSGQDTVQVWSAARDLPSGTRISAPDLRPVEVRLSGEIMSHYVPAERDLSGAVLSRSVLEGEMIVGGALSTGAAAVTGRSVMIPVEPEHALGGELRIGDLVDVLGTFNSGEPSAMTKALLRGAEVLDLSQTDGLVTGQRALTGITVAVTPNDSLRLVAAIRNAEIDIVRVDAPSDGSFRSSVRAGDL
jgi:pilus assembly protein CpaB